MVYTRRSNDGIDYILTSRSFHDTKCRNRKNNLSNLLHDMKITIYKVNTSDGLGEEYFSYNIGLFSFYRTLTNDKDKANIRKKRNVHQRKCKLLLAVQKLSVYS